MNPTMNPATIPPTPSMPAPTPMRRAAEALEASFLSEMLKSARLFEPAESLDGGAGEEQFTSFLADAHARAMVARGGLGLADGIERALIQRQGGQA